MTEIQALNVAAEINQLRGKRHEKELAGVRVTQEGLCQTLHG